ncbi:MAG: T9SS type A sorting domain-containing protein, partial [Candidatus Azobacteroides sp.]|nr:T9SS type A sorting domain-containing protein [Candidatus Azobacteroides sp.]
FLAQAPSTFPFVIKLEQTSDSNNSTQIQDWNTNPEYIGNGEWQEVHIGFDVIKNQLQQKLNANPNFPVSNYDRLLIVPAPYGNLPDFTLNIDNIKLRASWDDETGNQPINNADAIIIAVSNGIVSAKAGNGAPVSLKVYSLSGQEIARGVNQVQAKTKGIYILKAASGNANKVSKIIVQ